MERKVVGVPQMYAEMMVLMKFHGVPHGSRNGDVLMIEEPVLVHVKNPKDRVLTDPVRNANPFFHVMEFVWMMAGRNDPDFLIQFVKNFGDYADTNNKFRVPLLHGAYGHRWRRHFDIDQILTAIEMLKKYPESRRVVLGMWDPRADLMTDHNDLPCNTHIYADRKGDKLDMMVCNRSNDVIWGMCGANAVHMTFLQELMAQAVGIGVGTYRVVTNNAHVYMDLPNVEKMIQTLDAWYPRWEEPVVHVPLLQGDETINQFFTECAYFCNGHMQYVKNRWLTEVAFPIHELWHTREYDPVLIEDTFWRKACELWLQRKA